MARAGLQGMKRVLVTPPAAILDNTSASTTEIDTLGYDYCTIDVLIGASDIAMTALKVQESDTSGSGFGDVTGLVYGTSTNDAGSTSTLPTATDDNKVFSFEIDLRGRKRYLDLVATAGNGTNGTYVSAIAYLSRAEAGVEDSSSNRGVAQTLRLPA